MAVGTGMGGGSLHQGGWMKVKTEGLLYPSEPMTLRWHRRGSLAPS